jgi:hypothetical protein
MRRLVRLLPQIAIMLSLCLGVTGIAHADTSDSTTYGSGNYGNCDFGSCTITLSSSGSVAANVTPTAGGKCTVQNDTVSVLTDSSTGYNLTMTTSGTNTAMTSGGNSISASSGSAAAPVSLAVNTWGYRVDGLSGFGAGPASAQTNGSTPSTTFAGVPASNQAAVQIAHSSSMANPAVGTTVWFGVCANTTQPSGSYAAVITYTAITN